MTNIETLSRLQHFSAFNFYPEDFCHTTLGRGLDYGLFYSRARVRAFGEYFFSSCFDYGIAAEGGVTRRQYPSYSLDIWLHHLSLGRQGFGRNRLHVYALFG